MRHTNMNAFYENVIIKGRNIIQELVWDMCDYFLAEVVEGNEVPITLQYACSDVIHLSCFPFVKKTFGNTTHDREWKVLPNPPPADECSHCDHGG